MEGIELRDYFAGMALSGLAGAKLGFTDGQIASAAYRYADAMLKQRELNIEAESLRLVNELANMETPTAAWIAQ